MEHSQLPLAIGGGIRSIKDIKRYRKFGADRYVINQTEAESDTFVTEAVKEFGKSSIVSVSIIGEISLIQMELSPQKHYSKEFLRFLLIEVVSCC